MALGAMVLRWRTPHHAFGMVKSEESKVYAKREPLCVDIGCEWARRIAGPRRTRGQDKTAFDEGVFFNANVVLDDGFVQNDGAFTDVNGT